MPGLPVFVKDCSLPILHMGDHVWGNSVIRLIADTIYITTVDYGMYQIFQDGNMYACVNSLLFVCMFILYYRTSQRLLCYLQIAVQSHICLIYKYNTYQITNANQHNHSWSEPYLYRADIHTPAMPSEIRLGPNWHMVCKVTCLVLSLYSFVPEKEGDRDWTFGKTWVPYMT